MQPTEDIGQAVVFLCRADNITGKLLGLLASLTLPNAMAVPVQLS